MKEIKTKNRVIYSSIDSGASNIDMETVQSFGNEWKSFHSFNEEELSTIGKYYFDIVTDEMVNKDTVLGDFGCGSGRFIKYFQHKAKMLVGFDPSEAIFAADELIGKADHVSLYQASISDIPFPDGYFDFGMSIGVLHHIPDTQQAMNDCVKKVKPGGYFYTYIYYNLDNRGLLFKAVWKLSDLIRLIVSGLPFKLKMFVCELLAVLLYMPFVLLCRALKFVGIPKKIWQKIPLSVYQDKTFFVIRNDSLDRFGTPLEQRFSRAQIEQMMKKSGLTEIVFSEKPGFWHAVGKKV